jgi:hypothetical protein
MMKNLSAIAYLISYRSGETALILILQTPLGILTCKLSPLRHSETFKGEFDDEISSNKLRIDLLLGDCR